jgi:PAS domain S-box-containing protein
MQALSENSPDLITRFNQKGLCYYINPVIEQYTGKTTGHFINKSIEEVGLAPALTIQWLKLINEVKEQQAKISTEMSFPSILGDRVMQVNAIPEYTEDENLESVLVVSHDITERKAIELEIHSKNKKITESINYAKRIQRAILPDTKLINKIFPESFIYYRAKDVVSGDFPWFIKVGEDYYIAAVDCTGHGVPGALISLIGYFLLNDIVRSRKISDPGIILDQLDEGVTRTLRQDSDESSAKDGMDIALCKINLNKGELEYAGAHRPLYLMNKEALTEIKGNKFAIGGGIYKNQTNFTNHKFKISNGDSIYICSDGFPDQFGGPENRKFGPQRLRELIVNNHGMKMQDFYANAAAEWEKWKGENKQTDDVLLIGIKF